MVILFVQNCEFKSYLSNHAIKEWNKLDYEIRNAEKYFSFWKIPVEFIKPSENSVCKVCNLFKKFKEDQNFYRLTYSK